MIADAYSHVCPERLLSAIDDRRPAAEAAALRGNTCHFDGDARLRRLDRIKDDQQALALARPPMSIGTPRTVIHELTRATGESIAATTTASCGSESRPAVARAVRPADRRPSS